MKDDPGRNVTVAYEYELDPDEDTVEADTVFAINPANIVCDVCGEKGHFLAQCEQGGKQIVEAICEKLDSMEMATKTPDTLGRILNAVKKAKGIPDTTPFRYQRFQRFRRPAEGNRIR